jgi:hemoglobin
MSETTAQSAQTPYEILGDEGVRALADAFYEAMDSLPQAARVRAMHTANLDDIKRKLAAYLTGWMGGPPVYLAMKGTVCLTDPHAPYHIGPEERDQWLLCMDEALERVGASDELKAMLKEPMFRVADTVRNQDSSEPKPRDPNIIAVG